MMGDDKKRWKLRKQVTVVDLTLYLLLDLKYVHCKSSMVFWLTKRVDVFSVSIQPALGFQ